MKEENLDMLNIVDYIEGQMELQKLKKYAEEKNIFQILTETEEFIRIAEDKEIENVPLSAKIVEKIQSNLESLKLIEDLLPHFKDIFLNDKTYADGSSQISVVNIFKQRKYRKPLNEFLTDVRQNKNSDMQGFHNYMTFNDLSTKPVEISRTFNVLLEAIPVIIRNLEQNNIVEIDRLICNAYILISRISQLYVFYGYYLEDIDCLAQFTAENTAFSGIKYTFEDLISIICSLTKDVD